MARDFNDLTGPERAAMEVWTRGSADTTGMLCAVRAALHAEQKANARRVSRAERAREMLAADGYLTPEFRDFLTGLVADDGVVIASKED